MRAKRLSPHCVVACCFRFLKNQLNVSNEQPNRVPLASSQPTTLRNLSSKTPSSSAKLAPHLLGFFASFWSSATTCFSDCAYALIVSLGTSTFAFIRSKHCSMRASPSSFFAWPFT